LLKNLVPLAPLAGIILVAQGVVMLRMKGTRATAWFMVLPGMVVILVIVILPTIYTWGVSTVRWDAQVRDQSFIFLENYRSLLTTERVIGALQNTAIVAVGAVTLELILGVGLALLLTEQFRGRALVISVIILPLMLAPVVVGHTWRMLWDTRFGAVNDILSHLTGQTVELLWLGDPKLATIAIIITDVWQWTPFIFLITLAGFLAVNVELYEAAAIDGASGFQIFTRVTLPIVRPVLLVALLFRLVDALKIFDILFLLTKGGPGYATENYSLYLYEQGFQFFRLGYTAAGSVLFLIVMVIIATVLIRRIGET
jgi:multiple sugar transport system permease protein